MPTPIVAFSRDWHEDHTSNHHVLRELAKTRRVLWLNSVAARRPQMSSSRDVEKMRRKLREAGAGPVNVENDLWVATPLVLPLPRSRIARAVNRGILRATIRRLRERLDIDEFQLWTFLPSAGPYVGRLGESLTVYYCVDEWTTFGTLDAAATRRCERELLSRADVTFATSAALVEAKRDLCRAVYLSRHGVDHAKFARALDDDVVVPDDLAAIPAPRIGFFGTLREMIDVESIAMIARERPVWSIVLIGRHLTDLSALRELPNVYLLGQRAHDELPAYCKGFDVGLVPYRLDDSAPFINPLKLREYLSAGVPVVSTAMPEVEPYRHLCHIATSRAELVPAIERALAYDGPDVRRRRSLSMASETWQARVASIESILASVERSKAREVPAFVCSIGACV